MIALFFKCPATHRAFKQPGMGWRIALIFALSACGQVAAQFFGIHQWQITAAAFAVEVFQVDGDQRVG